MVALTRRRSGLKKLIKRNHEDSCYITHVRGKVLFTVKIVIENVVVTSVTIVGYIPPEKS